jgi:2-oxo-4-hydroxy-4-carboxy--5-ureidoimidazoline (OHCU) decarboxylase
MTQKLPSIGELRSLPEDSQTNALDLLFEPSPAIHATLLPVIQNSQCSSYPELIDECGHALFSLAAQSGSANPNPELLSVVGSHPRLGSKKVDSAQSAAEQANLQGEGEQLAELNREYEERFPGLRFVVFVNGRGRPEIMNDMRGRIDRGDFAKEVDEALQVRRY